jgi:hypothetical protein
VIPKVKEFLPNVEPCEFTLSISPTPDYIPQVGDKIVYFPRGHIDFLESSRLAEASSIEFIAPSEDQGISFARVKKIEWIPDFFIEYEDVGASSSSTAMGKVTRRIACPRARVHLELYDVDGDAETIRSLDYYEIGESMVVDFWREDGLNSFLVLHSRFARGMNLLVGDDVRIVSEEGDGMREGDIVEIRYDIMWNGVGVKNGEEICWYSCWDLKRVVELEDVDDGSIEELGLLWGFTYG